MEMVKILLLLGVVAFATAAPKSNDYEEEEDEKLRILSLSPQKLRAVYYTSADEGLQVISEDTPGSNYVTVSTLDGTLLVSARFSTSHSGVLWKILGYSFFLYNNTVLRGRSRVEAYVVPAETTVLVEKQLKRNHFTSKLLRTLHAEGVNETKDRAFSELFLRPELDDIFEMSKALGEAGVRGNDNPAALKFHGMALHFAKLRNRPEYGGDRSSSPEQEDGSAEEPVFIPRRISKRATCRSSRWWGRTRYQHGCTRCHGGSPECIGMCGNTCNCWDWVCGDCCYHQGCYDHDNCCDWHGYLSTECLFPWGFSCAGGYSC